jgi:predicted nucleotidyltransferase
MKTDYSFSKKHQLALDKVKALLMKEGCREVYLFGSLATGTATESSDIDVGIKGLPPEKFFHLYARLEEEVPYHVDLIDFDTEIDFFNMLSSVGEVVRLG